MNKFEFKNLTPFKWFVLENFPFIEADFDALTEWQLFCKLGKEMNKIINSENVLGEQVENVTNAFIQLENYVNNYFDNLDVQEEINNKLNDMVLKGELQEIIADYLNSKAIFGYDNINDMINSTNLINGSYAQTFGFYERNDGGKALYKIRNINNNDIVDNKFIIQMNNENLIAELIYDTINIKQIGAKHNNDITEILQLALNKVKNVFIPEGYYFINQTIKTNANNSLLMDNNTYLKLSNINGFYIDGNSIINGGNIITPENYSKNVITMLPTSVTKLDEKIGGLFNLSIKNTTQFSDNSTAITFDFTDNTGLETDGITYQTFENIEILNFDYGIKAVNSNTSKWITSLNWDNIKMTHCKKFIYANVGREFSGNKFTNMHLQIDKNNLNYVIYLGGKCENNYFNIIEWDLDAGLNQKTIYLSNLTMNNKIEADRLFNYGTLKYLDDNGKNNYITSAFIENTYLNRTNMKTIDLTHLDNTKAYPVLFENMCNIKLWKNSETGFIYSYLYAVIDAVSQRAGGMLPNYFARISTLPAEKMLPKIISNNANRYIAVYLRGGFKYNFLDYNYEYQETNSKEYYYDPSFAKPYKIVEDTFTSGGITYTPIETDNSIPRGMYYNSYQDINLDKNSTPLNLV